MEMMIICDRQTDTDTLEWRRCSKTRKSRKTSNQMSTPVLIDILNIIIILIVLIIMMIIKGVCPMLRLSFCAMAVERFHMFLQEWTVVPLPPLHSEHFCKDVMIKSWTKLTNPQIYEERQMVHVSPKVSHALSLLYLFLYLYLYYILLYLHLYPHCIVSIFSHELPLVCPFFICVYIFNCICVFIWICICICIYICICICVCICVCIWICICIPTAV